MERLKWKVLCLALLLVFAPSILVAADYIGSQKCAMCHTDVYDKWKISLHNKSQQELSPTNDRVVADWKGVLKLKSGNTPRIHGEIVEEGSDYFATLVEHRIPPLKQPTKLSAPTAAGDGNSATR